MSVTEELYFPNITSMIKEVKDLYNNSENNNKKYTSLKQCLVDYIRIKKYWPMIQLKVFKDDNNIALLHNTYKRNDVKHFKELYEESRSVVLDLSSVDGNNIVVSLADKTPIRITDVDYEKNIKDDEICEFSYEGTMIYVYNHNNKWMFGTTTCPSMDNSIFFHPTKTHGVMFDEYLEKIFNNSSNDNLIDDDDVVMDGEDNVSNVNNNREKFCEYLNKDYTYGFMLVHHENKHIMDYTSEFGEGYKELFHIFTREKITAKSVNHQLNLPVKYITKTTNKKEALNILRNNKGIYALIVTNPINNVVYKVSLKNIIEIENENIGNSNIWMNLLHVYFLKRHDFKINDYINKYLTKNQIMEIYNIKIDNGIKISPTFIIDNTMKYIANLLNFAYKETTNYDIASRKYSINYEVDKSLLPTMRYHMAQIRDFHKKFYSNLTSLNCTHLMKYLCNTRLKDIRLLVNHIHKEYIYHKYMEYDTYKLFDILQMKLKEN